MSVKLGPYFGAASTEELQRRWIAVRKVMADKDVDCLMTGGYNNALGGAVRYFTDYGNTGSHYQILIIPKEGDMAFFGHCNFSGRPIPPPATRGVELCTGAPFLVSCSYSDDYIPIEMVKFLKAKNIRKIGIHRPNSLPYQFVQYILDNVDGISLAKIDSEIDYMMAVKSEEELLVLREVCKLHDQIYQIIPTILRPGRRERDVSTDLKKAAFDMGMEEVNNTMVGAGNPKAKHKPFLLQNNVIKEGDNVDILIELSGPGGYWGELSRMWCLGEPSKELQQASDDALRMQTELAKIARPGVPTVEFAKTLHKFQDERGYKRSDGLFGHGQGTDMSQRPTFSYDETMEFRENMFVSIHPGMETDNIWVFHTDNFIIMKDGAVRVNKTPQGLFFV